MGPDQTVEFTRMERTSGFEEKGEKEKGVGGFRRVGKTRDEAGLGLYTKKVEQTERV